MNYKIETIPNFDKELKRLAKKFKSLKNDIISFTKELQDNIKIGTPLGKDCYKIRLTIKSKGKGKSGGARIITHIKIIDNVIFLLSIYDKSEKDNITDKELKKLIQDTYN